MLNSNADTQRFVASSFPKRTYICTRCTKISALVPHINTRTIVWGQELIHRKRLGRSNYPKMHTFRSQWTFKLATEIKVVEVWSLNYLFSWGHWIMCYIELSIWHSSHPTTSVSISDVLPQTKHSFVHQLHTKNLSLWPMTQCTWVQMSEHILRLHRDESLYIEQRHVNVSSSLQLNFSI